MSEVHFAGTGSCSGCWSAKRETVCEVFEFRVEDRELVELALASQGVVA